ncbi:hypothetical protein [Paraburkholderia sp. BL21I4N1]|uniref:hypothetical protein n=1 Tax=Paraburkholderia sp. BL21I4N1 TaxID=1938801 RepID=UPI0011B28A50|nr:hypothetical protein [Paraburkholderia sp. BL21I4N1]
MLSLNEQEILLISGGNGGNNSTKDDHGMWPGGGNGSFSNLMSSFAHGAVSSIDNMGRDGCGWHLRFSGWS